MSGPDYVTGSCVIRGKKVLVAPCASVDSCHVDDTMPCLLVAAAVVLLNVLGCRLTY